MKKSLVALAALAATGAFAQSSVTLYGVMDIGYKAQTYKDAGVTTVKANGVADGAVAGPRFGFRGTEDLGGGLKANFVIEQGISPTSSQLTNYRTATSAPQIDTTAAGATTGRSATSLNRQSWVGLSGKFGEVRAGYQYTNLYELSTLSGFNAGSEGTNGADSAHTYGNAAVGGTRANGLTYITPAFGGFSAQLQYGAATSLDTFESKNAADTQVHAKRTGILANYNAGALSVKVAYTEYKNGTAAGNTAIVDKTGKLTQVGARYDFGMLALTGTYNDGKNGDAGAAAREYQAYQLGVTVPVGAFKLIATTGKAETTNSVGAKTEDLKQAQFAVQYALSKRTTAYFYSGQTKDAATGGVDKKSSNILGVIHTF
ncbi:MULTISPECIES: porin [unclassified Ramlibacter]|uniref:porin n=1 Tax=unclassified Ramlibacter TaxID=2617605 RepID=UPI00362A0886